MGAGELMQKSKVLQDEMQLIEHINSMKVHKTLLLEPVDLLLSRTPTVALHVESAAVYLP